MIYQVQIKLNNDGRAAYIDELVTTTVELDGIVTMSEIWLSPEWLNDELWQEPDILHICQLAIIQSGEIQHHYPFTPVECLADTVLIRPLSEADYYRLTSCWPPPDPLPLFNANGNGQQYQLETTP